MSLAHLVREIKDIKRFEQILVVLIKNGLGFLVDKLKLKHIIPVHERVHKDRFKGSTTSAVRIRNVFEELGGTFIKLGQLLSLRPDLIPKEYCAEFKKMQDEVPAFASNLAKDIVNRELAKSGKKFAYFSPKPIAAASIGQVHEAVLKNGKKVVVKVQRPKIRELIETDIDIMYYLARLIEKHYGTELFNATAIVQEFERYTHNEFDYVVEARNIDKFYKNFEHDRKVIIPKVYWDYTTDKILTMDFLKGFKISHLKKIEKRRRQKRRITKEIAEIVFKQIFIHGFFHADPHPGNILIMADNKLGLLDFGIVGYIDRDLKENFSELFVALIDKDLNAIADSMLNLGVVEATIDVDELKGDLRNSLGRYYETPLKEMDIGYLFHSLVDIAKKDKIKLPANFVLLGKALVTLQGFAVELDPDFNLVETAKPFVEKLKKRAMEPAYIFEKSKRSLNKFRKLIAKLPDSVNDLLMRAKDVDKGIKDIDTDIKIMTVELDRSSNRVALGMLVMGFVVASALMINEGEPVLWGIPTLSLVGFAIALVLVFLVMKSIIREKRLKGG